MREGAPFLSVSPIPPDSSAPPAAPPDSLPSHPLPNPLSPVSLAFIFPSFPPTAASPSFLLPTCLFLFYSFRFFISRPSRLPLPFYLFQSSLSLMTEIKARKKTLFWLRRNRPNGYNHLTGNAGTLTVSALPPPQASNAARRHF